MSGILYKQIDKNGSTARYYRSLMKNMLIIGFFLPFLPLILVCGIIYWQFHAVYQKNIQIQLEESVISGRDNLDRFLKERTGNLLNVIESFNQEKQDSFENIHKDFQIFYKGAFTNLGLINGQGVQVFYSGSENTFPITDSWSKWLVDRETIARLIPGRQGETNVIAAARVFRREEPWILWSTISPQSLAPVLNDTGKGTFFLLDKSLKKAVRVIEFPGKTEEPVDHFPIISELIPKDLNPDSTAVIKHSIDSGGESIWAATLLNNDDWVLLYKREAKEAFADLRATRNVILIAIFTTGVLIAANAFRLSKKTVYRIRRADKKKQQMNEHMFQTAKLASIGELAAGIAHEINNPVAVMIEEAGWIDDLLEEKEFHESRNLTEFKRALNQIQTQGRRCKDITRKLLSFARKTDFGLKKVRMHELIEDIVAITGKRAEYSQVTLTTDISKDLPELYVPETELQQVILNLINNALDSMEETGGELSLSAGTIEGGIMIDVSDTGPGIPRENLLRIFDPFFTTKPVGKGTGLGLSICYGIIRKMGGEITVDSLEGKGTVFHIRIPFRQEAPLIKIPAGVENSTATI